MNTLTSLSFGSFVSGMTAELTGGNFWQGAAVGFIVGLLNHQAQHLISKINTIVAGIYGAGSENNTGNKDLRELVEK